MVLGGVCVEVGLFQLEDFCNDDLVAGDAATDARVTVVTPGEAGWHGEAGIGKERVCIVDSRVDDSDFLACPSVRLSAYRVP